MSSLLRMLFIFFCLNSPVAAQIPRTLWQTWKSQMLPPQALEARQTWVNLNPEFSCYLCDDAEIEHYIRQKWDAGFLEMFRQLPIGAMKADLWRYLILSTEGGVYSDIDSLCLRPIREWPLPQNAPHVLLLDVDSDQSRFCQWTFAATPGHPALRHVCNYVLQRWKKRGLVRNTDGTIDVLSTTGPSIFSAALKDYLQEPHTGAAQIFKRYHSDKKYRKKLNRLGIFLTPKHFFSGVGAKNLFWGTWSNRN